MPDQTPTRIYHPSPFTFSLRVTQFLAGGLLAALTAYLISLFIPTYRLLSSTASMPLGALASNELVFCLTYSLVLSTVSFMLSFVFLHPFPYAHFYAIDLFVSGNWFLMFALLQRYYADQASCSEGGEWERKTCGVWSAAIAFAFLGAVAWFVSFLVGNWEWWSRKQRELHIAAGTTP